MPEHIIIFASSDLDKVIEQHELWVHDNYNMIKIVERHFAVATSPTGDVYSYCLTYVEL